jgi:hypothetical protein
MDPKEKMQGSGLDQLAQERVEGRALVITVMNIPVLKMQGISLLAESYVHRNTESDVLRPVTRLLAQLVPHKNGLGEV